MGKSSMKPVRCTMLTQGQYLTLTNLCRHSKHACLPPSLPHPWAYQQCRRLLLPACPDRKGLPCELFPTADDYRVVCKNLRNSKMFSQNSWVCKRSNRGYATINQENRCLLASCWRVRATRVSGKFSSPFSFYLLQHKCLIGWVRNGLLLLLLPAYFSKLPSPPAASPSLSHQAPG